MGIVVNLLPVEFDANHHQKFRTITEFKDKEWVEGNNYWLGFLEKIYNVRFNITESNTILLIIYNGQAQDFVSLPEYFNEVKEKLDDGTYKKVIIFQNEVNWDTFEKLLEIEDFFYKIFKDDKRFLFVRNIFKSKFNFTKINSEFTFGCFPFQLLHNFNETMNFNYDRVEKKFHLFSANCNVKEERLHLYQFLEKGNHWYKTNTSFFLPLFGTIGKKFDVKDFLSSHFLKANLGIGNKYKSNLGDIDLDIKYVPKKLKYDNFSQVKNLAIKDSTESLFQIIMETRYHSHCGIVLSEKIFKGFLYKTPFIIFAQHGVLKLLKELGFRTFDWLIDESYDSEIDDGIRLKMLLEESNKLLNTNFYDLNDLIQTHKEDFEHNYNLVKTFADGEILKIFKMFYV